EVGGAEAADEQRLAVAQDRDRAARRVGSIPRRDQGADFLLELRRWIGRRERPGEREHELEGHRLLPREGARSRTREPPLQADLSARAAAPLPARSAPPPRDSPPRSGGCRAA